MIISPADKGDAVVIQDTCHYLDLAVSIFNGSKTYQSLDEDPTTELAN